MCLCNFGAILSQYFSLFIPCNLTVSWYPLQCNLFVVFALSCPIRSWQPLALLITQMKHLSYVGWKKLICNMLTCLYFISKLTAVTVIIENPNGLIPQNYSVSCKFSYSHWKYYVVWGLFPKAYCKHMRRLCFFPKHYNLSKDYIIIVTTELSKKPRIYGVNHWHVNTTQPTTLSQTKVFCI